MKLLTIRNLTNRRAGVFCVSILLGTFAITSSTAFAQSSVVSDVSSVIEKLLPNPNAPTQESLSGLLRVDERSYQVSFDSSVSSQVLSSGTVRKIEFGRESLVTIVSTSSGTYSTDALASNHVLYPGVSVVDTTLDMRNLVLKVLLNGEYVDWSTVSEAFTGS